MVRVKCKDCGNLLIDDGDIVGLVPIQEWDMVSVVMEEIYYVCTSCGRRFEYDKVCELCKA